MAASSSELFIYMNKGMNVAPWNFHERAVICQDGDFFIDEREKIIGSALNNLHAKDYTIGIPKSCDVHEDKKQKTQKKNSSSKKT